MAEHWAVWILQSDVTRDTSEGNEKPAAGKDFWAIWELVLESKWLYSGISGYAQGLQKSTFQASTLEGTVSVVLS